MDYSISESVALSKDSFIYQSTIENLKKFRKAISQEKFESNFEKPKNESISMAKRMLKEYQKKKSMNNTKPGDKNILRETLEEKNLYQRSKIYTKTSSSSNLFFQEKVHSKETNNFIFKEVNEKENKDSERSNSNKSRNSSKIDSQRVRTSRGPSTLYSANQNQENFSKIKGKMEDYFSKPFNNILKAHNKQSLDISKFRANIKRSLSNSEFLDESIVQKLRNRSNLRYKDLYEIKKQMREDDSINRRKSQGVDSEKGKSVIKDILSRNYPEKIRPFNYRK